MFSVYVQNRQQQKLEVFTEIPKILDVDTIEFIVSTKQEQWLMYMINIQEVIT
jgi:hypothetical protein